MEQPRRLKLANADVRDVDDDDDETDEGGIGRHREGRLVDVSTGEGHGSSSTGYQLPPILS